MGETTFQPVEGTDETRFLQRVGNVRDQIPTGSRDGRDDIPTGSKEGENTFPLVVGMDETLFLQGVRTTKHIPTGSRNGRDHIEVAVDGRVNKFLELHVDRDGKYYIYAGCKGRTRPNFCW
jgi:hypothetical protein